MIEINLYTRRPELNDRTFKSSSDETIVEKSMKFCVVHNEGMGI